MNNAQWKAMEYARDGMFVPEELTREILSKLKINTGDKIAVLYSYEMLPVLHELGYKKVTFVQDNPKPFVRSICKQFGYTVISVEEYNSMRWELTLGNPPFSFVNKKTGRGRGKDLYPGFYRNAINNSNVVAMIMPSTQQTVNKKHNNLLKETANHIVPCKFNGINLATWYVISDGSDAKPDVDWVHDGQDQNDIDFAKGKLNVSGDVECLKRDKKRKGDITVYHKVTETTGLVVKYCSPKLVPERKRFPKSGYALLMPQAINEKGWSKTAIVKCTGNEAAMNGVNIAFFDTKEEAKELRDYMKTEEYIRNACKVRGGQGNMTLSAMKQVPINI